MHELVRMYVHVDRLSALQELYVKPGNDELCGQVPERLPAEDRDTGNFVGPSLKPCLHNDLGTGAIAGANMPGVTRSFASDLLKS